jgi:hypothetical protein
MFAPSQRPSEKRENGKKNERKFPGGRNSGMIDAAERKIPRLRDRRSARDIRQCRMRVCQNNTVITLYNVHTLAITSVLLLLRIIKFV